ncbi:MAG TPA: hypothetical protein DCM08_12980 [Microscillaceae bacterium]|nr:hypothetical protein [Microscillaceae bacterium]
MPYRYALAAVCLVVGLSFVWGCDNSKKEKTFQYFNKGTEYLRRKDLSKALHYFNQALLLSPDQPDLYNNRGIVYYQQKNYQAALTDYNQALQLKQNYPDALYNRALLYYEQGKYAEALADLDKAALQQKDSAQVFLSRARVKLQLRDFQGSISDLDTYLTLNPQEAMGYESRAYLYYRMHQPESAQKDWAKALSFDKNLPLTLANQALLEARNRQFEQALVLINQALALDAEETYVLDAKAWIYLQMNKVKEAQQNIELSWQKDSTQNAWVLRNKGVLLLAQKKPEQALVLFQKAEQIQPAVELLYFYMGEAYQQLNQNEKACGCWKKEADLQHPESLKQIKAQC